MGKSTPQAPAAPDPKETAAAQGAINKETAIAQARLNNVNQVGPYGTSTFTTTGGGQQYDNASYDKAMQSWNTAMAGGASTGEQPILSTREAHEAAISAPNNRTGVANAGPMPTLDQFKLGDPSVPQYTQTINLSPEEQQKLNLTQQAGIKTGQIANSQLGRLNDTLSQPINYDNAPGLQSSIDPNSPAYKAALDAQMQRVNPQIDQDRAKLEQRLASQGITYGQEAYNNAFQPFEQGANDARSQAGLSAFQTALQNAQLGNTARQQSIQESASIRNQPLNEISALLSGTQVNAPQFSNFAQTPIQPADYTGAANLKYQGDLANYNSKIQGQNAAMGGLFGLGGSVLGAGLGKGGFLMAAPAVSDRRMKRDIIPLGTLFKSFPLYLFKYIWSDKPEIGVMAQEVMETRPDAVVDIDGILHVNYGAL